MKKTEHSIKSMGLGVVKIISFLVVVLFLQRIIIIPLSIISKTYWSHLDGRGLNEPWFLSTSLAFFGVSLVVTFFYLKYVDKAKWSYLRITSDRYTKHFSSGAAAAFILVVLMTVMNLVIGYTSLSVDFSSFGNLILYLSIFLVGLVFLVAYEEIIFRGYILRTLEKHFGSVTAIVLSSLLFSLLHAQRPDFSLLPFVNIFLAGVLLSIICIYADSLWLPLGFHFGWNYFLWLFNYPISDQRYINPLFKLSYNDYNLFTGSKFGPEDSLLFTILLIIMITLTLYIFKNRNKMSL